MGAGARLPVGQDGVEAPLSMGTWVGRCRLTQAVHGLTALGNST